MTGTALATRPVAVVVSAEELSTVREQWVEQKRQELERGQEALAALRTAGAGPAKIARTRDRLAMLKRVVKALEAGYVPIPRFDSQTLQIDLQELPAKALVALGTAKQRKVFTEIRLVTGREAGGRGRWRVTQRDPLIVGIIRTPGYRIPRHEGDTWPITVPPTEEHFMIAWWRPEDERLEEMF